MLVVIYNSRKLIARKLGFLHTVYSVVFCLVTVFRQLEEKLPTCGRISIQIQILNGKN